MSHVPARFDAREPPEIQTAFDRRTICPGSADVDAALFKISNLTPSYTPMVANDRLQLVVPVSGVHYVDDGRRDALVDLNHLTVIHPRVATRDRHPSVGDCSVLLLTPSEETLEELWPSRDRRWTLGGCLSKLEQRTSTSTSAVSALIAISRQAIRDRITAVRDHGGAKSQVSVRDRVADVVAGRADPFEARIPDRLL